MGIIRDAGRPEHGHRCDPPKDERDNPAYAYGSIWLCDECGQTWRVADGEYAYYWRHETKLGRLWREFWRALSFHEDRQHRPPWTHFDEDGALANDSDKGRT